MNPPNAPQILMDNTSMIRIVILVCVLAVLLLLTGGCNILAPIAFVAAPEPTVEAQYPLEDRATVVFIDDRSNVVNPVSLRNVIAEKTSSMLMDEEVVTDMIRPRDAAALAVSRDRANELLAIDDIGREVGADVVIYVRMRAFTPQIDRWSYRAGAVADVKVLDVVSQQRLFPPPGGNEDTFAVRTIINDINPDLYRSRSSRLQILEMLALELGDDIARLFFKHRPKDTLGERLQTR